MKAQYPVTRSDAEWRKLLNPEQYMVMRRFGTEPAGNVRSSLEAPGHLRLRGLRSTPVRRQDEIRKQFRLAEFLRSD